MRRIAAVFAGAALIALAGCEAEVEEQGNMPDVEVEEGAELPEYNVEGPDVEMTEDTVTVPDVDVEAPE